MRSFSLLELSSSADATATVSTGYRWHRIHLNAAKRLTANAMMDAAMEPNKWRTLFRTKDGL